MKDQTTMLQLSLTICASAAERPTVRRQMIGSLDRANNNSSLHPSLVFWLFWAFRMSIEKHEAN